MARDKKKVKKAVMAMDEEEMEDKVDRFVKQNQKISLADDDEEDGQSDLSEEGAFDLDDEESEEDEEEEEDEEDDDEVEFGMNKFDDEEDGDEVDAEDVENVVPTGWGKGKGAYYKESDEEEMGESSEEEIEKEELEEAKRQQAKLFRHFDRDDFMGDIKLEKAKTKESEMLAAMNEDLKSVRFGPGGMTEEKIRKDIDRLPTDEKLAILESEAPELLTLTKDLRKSIDELRQVVLPLVAKLRGSNIPTAKGMSYLELKYHLLLSYCVNVAFYMLLKTSGERVEDHPVIRQLVRIRVVLEKMRPLDQKLKYQIDKLLKLSNLPEDALSQGGGGGGDSLEADSEALNFKPNLENLIAAGDDEASAEADGVYRPPKISAVHYQNDDDGRQSKHLEKKKQKIAKSSIMNFIREEFGDAPLEVRDTDGVGIHSGKLKALEKEKEREKFEEDRFIRLPLTKKDRKRRKDLENPFGQEDLLVDFDDIAAYEREEKSGETVTQHLKESKPRSSRHSGGGDIDLPYSSGGKDHRQKFGKKGGGFGGKRKGNFSSSGGQKKRKKFR
jgi:hypothetical protein